MHPDAASGNAPAAAPGDWLGTQRGPVFECGATSGVAKRRSGLRRERQGIAAGAGRPSRQPSAAAVRRADPAADGTARAVGKAVVTCDTG
jgi:hypothetical protein